jgi:hypothetical protein
MCIERISIQNRVIIEHFSTTPLASYGTGGGSSLFKRSTAFGSNTGSR